MGCKSNRCRRILLGPARRQNSGVPSPLLTTYVASFAERNPLRCGQYDSEFQLVPRSVYRQTATFEVSTGINAGLSVILCMRCGQSVTLAQHLDDTLAHMFDFFFSAS